MLQRGDFQDQSRFINVLQVNHPALNIRAEEGIEETEMEGGETAGEEGGRDLMTSFLGISIVSLGLLLIHPN